MVKDYLDPTASKVAENKIDYYGTALGSFNDEQLNSIQEHIIRYYVPDETIEDLEQLDNIDRLLRQMDPLQIDSWELWMIKSYPQIERY